MTILASPLSCFIVFKTMAGSAKATNGKKKIISNSWLASVQQDVQVVLNIDSIPVVKEHLGR